MERKGKDDRRIGSGRQKTYGNRWRSGDDPWMSELSGTCGARVKGTWNTSD